MSNFMDVRFQIDLNNSQQVQNLIKVLEGFVPTKETPQPDKVASKKETLKDATPKKETSKEEVKKTPKEQKNNRKEKEYQLQLRFENTQKETLKDATPKKETSKEEVKKTPKEEKQDTGGQEVKIEDLRALVVEKKDNHRSAVKEKLTEFGVKNITTLQKENYEAFRDFLKSL